MHKIGRLGLEVPSDFVADEATLSFVTRQEPKGPRRSILAHCKQAPPGSSLVKLAGDALSELTQSVRGITDVSQAEIQFDDGKIGIMLVYNYPARKQEVLRQYYAMRLDGDQVTTLTLSAMLGELDDAAAQGFLKTIGSLKAT
jgi:hypothetical protein